MALRSCPAPSEELGVLLRFPSSIKGTNIVCKMQSTMEAVGFLALEPLWCRVEILHTLRYKCVHADAEQFLARIPTATLAWSPRKKHLLAFDSCSFGSISLKVNKYVITKIKYVITKIYIL